MPGLEDEFGDVIRKARLGLGLELAGVSSLTGISERDLKGMEVYTRRPDEAEVRALARALQLRPGPLWELAQDSWSAPEVPWSIGDDFTVDRITTDYPEHCYVVTSRHTNECLIVDPGDAAEQIAGVATQSGRKPVAILLTHGHRDHAGAVVPVHQATRAPVYVFAGDERSVADVPVTALRVLDGDTDVAAGAITFRALHTPGHTPGSASYRLQSGGHIAVFCGDTLFAGSAGRPSYRYEALLRSLREKLLTLPPATVLYPGHGPATTVGNERERNPFL